MVSLRLHSQPHLHPCMHPPRLPSSLLAPSTATSPLLAPRATLTPILTPACTLPPTTGCQVAEMTGRKGRLVRSKSSAGVVFEARNASGVSAGEGGANERERGPAAGQRGADAQRQQMPCATVAWAAFGLAVVSCS